MSQPTRTLNPLHFEDLEPHRFEDLVRQLAYGFRPWRQLEAVGRLGRDDGMDIRGIEVADDRSISESSAALDAGYEAEEAAERVPIEEREWRIQCKRYKEIGPKLMREIVQETVPDPQATPYGLIVAAACDVSAETMAAFRDELLSLAVAEGHLWTKAHLEDMLFLPNNDHLLFAYFGISLGLRRQSRVQGIRRIIAIKGKLMRALKMASAEDYPDVQEILIRDVEDQDYPYDKNLPQFAQVIVPPWFVVRMDRFHPRGLLIEKNEYLGWVRTDGTWDIITDSGHLTTMMGMLSRESQKSAKEQDAEEARWILWNKAPDQERTYIVEVRFIPYSVIVEVDPIGDPWYSGPHVFCRFNGDDGPFWGEKLFLKGRGYDADSLLEESRRPLFAELQKEMNAD
ncbi:MAG TPA: hypothetical protein VHS06_03085 [Chloroflexota bacterium]|nr:hypothetical protein [Chloroflexota bacterium]